MATTNLFSDPTRLVDSALRAVTLTNPAAGLDATNKIVYLRPGYERPQQRVSVVSGGGSGHEPSFSSMVGRGLLSAAVAGTIFASPNSEQIRVTIMARVENNGLAEKDDPKGGILVIVMNYTGDMLNFGVAVETARAAGARVELVTVGDDVAVGRSRAGKVGRRGLVGTVLVHKIAGSLAARGYSLSQVAGVTRLVAENIVTIGASLEHAHVPGSTSVIDSLREGEIEIGMGIHNEEGWSREKISLPHLLAKLLGYLLARDDPERSFVDFHVASAGVVLLVNNLGGLSPLEIGGVVAEVQSQLEATHNIRPIRIFSGTYMTSLDSRGFSITLLRITDIPLDGTCVLDLLDDPCEALGWASVVSKETWTMKHMKSRTGGISREVDCRPSGSTFDKEVAQRSLVSGLKCLIASEEEITRFDMIVGDGDCGTTLKRGAQAVLDTISNDNLSSDVVISIAKVVRVVEQTMDGTSGAIYAIFLNALLVAVRDLPPGEMTPKRWAAALFDANIVLGKYTPARPGDRTVIDALYPFVETLGRTENLRKASDASLRAAESTQAMEAKLGRTVYIGGSQYSQVPDPGAWGLAMFLKGLDGSFV